MILCLWRCASRWTDVLHLLLNFFRREKTHHRKIFIYVLACSLILIEDIVLTLAFHFHLASTFLLNFFVVIFIILLLKSSQRFFSQRIKEEVDIDAIFVKVDLSKVQFVPLVTLIAPDTSCCKSCQQTEGSENSPR
jgi:hypothetical protein